MSYFSLKGKGIDLIAHLVVFATIYAFLISYFRPDYLFSETITTGGDTPSHYAAAEYLIHTLLPKGRIIGWMPGNYAGFPLFQFYFPLPFLLMALLQVLLPLQIAFKLVTVLGTFLLPVCAYGCLRLLRQPSPIPVIGAIFSLPFLFMEANSMWGGNIPSTLSGEFAYSLGFALLVLYMGSFYRGITEGRYTLLNTLILTLIGLAHGYTLLFAVFATTFFIFTTEGFLSKLWYYFRVKALAFLLLGFWLVQLLWFMPYTTPFNFVCVLDGISQVFPAILIPVIALAAGGTVLVLVSRLRGKQEAQKKVHVFLYLWFAVLVAGAFYFVAYEIDLVDIRFLPYVQFLLMLLGAIALGPMTRWMKTRQILSPFLVFLAILWVDSQVSTIPKWIEWDYTGVETKSLWPQFDAVNAHLKGSYQDPRVVYEHDSGNRAAGSVRAFESLPHFSGRSTLEGLYIQSSITSPFVFYLQSEISPKPSCPLQNYNYSRVNIKRALAHLRLFNVSHLIVLTDEVREALEGVTQAIPEREYAPYSIYRLTSNPDRYVSLLHYEPILVIAKDWRRIAFEWFRRSDLQIHLVFRDKTGTEDTKRFKTVLNGDMKDLMPRIPRLRGIPISNATTPQGDLIKATIEPEEINIETAYIGRPHLIRVSYHPNWHVEGADRVYLVSPSFMLIYPQQEKVRLCFGPSFPDYLGWAFSLIGVFIALCSIGSIQRLTVFCYPLFVIRNAMSRFARQWPAGRVFNLRSKKRLLWGVSLGIIVMLTVIILIGEHKDPIIIYNRGMDYYKKADYRKARVFFEKGIETFPLSPIIDQTAFYLGITYFKEEDWQTALNVFEEMVRAYPESRKLPEVLYHMGLCHLKMLQHRAAIDVFNRIIAQFPEDRWAGYARERLQELSS